MTVSELEAIPPEDRNERQEEFLRYFHMGMPVGTGDCVMNRICRKFEDAFDGYIGKRKSQRHFDYSIMKSDAEYLPKQYSAIKRLYEDYNRRVMNFVVFADYERVDEFESFAILSSMDEEFQKECVLICPDRMALCNIVLDLCYTRSSTKRFAWNMCGDEIIENLLVNNGGRISYPTLCEDGEIEYGGNRFTIETTEIGADTDDNSIE
jgi:hypothetical protein